MAVAGLAIATAADPCLLLTGMFAISPILNMGPLALPTLVRGGLRGDISVALALLLPEGPLCIIILASTYVIVLFVAIIRGGSAGWLIAQLSKKKGLAA